MKKKTRNFLCVSRRLLLENTLCAREIAATLGVSESYFRAHYLHHFGLAPKKYIQTVRMKKAQTLLRTTNQSVGEVAHTLSYVNASKFSAAFKRQFGLTPSQYQQKCGFGVECHGKDML